MYSLWALRIRENGMNSASSAALDIKIRQILTGTTVFALTSQKSVVNHVCR